MKTKILEIRDGATFIAVLAVDMNPDLTNDGREAIQRYYLRRYGYPCDYRPNIMITHLNGGEKANNDPYDWGGRTYPTAHAYIIENWHGLIDGDVIDVEYILKETHTPKVSERLSIKET